MVVMLRVTCLDVRDEVALVGTSVLAEGAYKRLLACVFSDVYGQFGLTDGLISTHTASILPSSTGTSTLLTQLAPRLPY